MTSVRFARASRGGLLADRTTDDWNWHYQVNLRSHLIGCNLAGIWNGALDRAERLGLIDMARQAACAATEPSTIQLNAIERLAERLDVSSHSIRIDLNMLVDGSRYWMNHSRSIVL